MSPRLGAQQAAGGGERTAPPTVTTATVASAPLHLDWQPSPEALARLRALSAAKALVVGGRRVANPLASDRWFSERRQAPAGQNAARLYLQGYRQAQRMPVFQPHGRPASVAGATTAPSEFGGAWTELGPRPQVDPQYGAVSGRVTAIAVDNGKDPSGNTIYVGTAFGGVWKSTNALSATPTFTSIGDNMPSLAVGAIALDSSTNPTTIYVGTGEANNGFDNYYGVGILKSTDGGSHWSVSSTVAATPSGGIPSFVGDTFSRILVDPVTPSKVFACTSVSGAEAFQDGGTLYVSAVNLGLYESQDSGASWTALAYGAPCTDIVYDNTTSTYYVAFAGNGVYSFNEAGSNFNQLPTTFPSGTSPTGKNDSRMVLAVRNGTLYALTAGANGKPGGGTACSATVTSGCDTGLQSYQGGHWTAIAIPDTSGTAAQTLFCEPAPDNSWCQGTYDLFLGLPAGGNGLVLGGIDVFSSAGVANTPLSTSWTNVTNGYTTGVVHPDQHVFASNVAGNVWFIGNDGGVWVTTDAGAHWHDLNATLATIQFMGASPDLGTPGVVFAGSQDNGTAMNSTGSSTWNLILGGDGGYTANNPSNVQQYFAEQEGINLFRSDDHGGTFGSVVDDTTIKDASDFYVPYELLPSDPSRAMLGTTELWSGPTAPASSGQGWATIPSPQGEQSCSNNANPAVITALAIAPSDPNTVYVGYENGDVQGTHDLNDATPQWNQLINGFLANMNVNCRTVSTLAVDPGDPNRFLAAYQGLDGAAHLVLDSSNQASDITGNLPELPVNSVLFEPDAPWNVFVASDAGVYVAGDGGQPGEQWSQLGTGLPATAVLNLAWVPGASPQLLAATHGRGAWEIPAQAPPAFQLQTPTTQIQQALAASTTFPVSVVGRNGFQGTVQLSCSTTVPCSISPASLAAGQTATVSVTLGGYSGVVEVSISGSANGETYTLPVVSITGDTYQLTALAVQFPGFFSLRSNILGTGGASAKGSFWMNPSASSFSQPITLSCPGLPAGVTCVFATNPITLGASEAFVTFTLQASATATTGVAPLTVQAQSGSFAITSSGPTFNVSDFSLAVTPANPQVNVGSDSVSMTAVATSLNGSANSIALTCGVSSGLSCSLSPTTITPGQNASVTVSGLNSYFQNSPGATVDVAVFGNEQPGAPQAALVPAPQASITEPDFRIGTQAPPPTFLLGALDSEAFGVIGNLYSGMTGTINASCSSDMGTTCALAPTQLQNNWTAAVSGLSKVSAGSTVTVTFTGTVGTLTHTSTAKISVAAVGIVTGLGNTQVSVAPGATTANTTLQGVNLGGNYTGAFLLSCADPTVTCVLDGNASASLFAQAGAPVSLGLSNIPKLSPGQSYDLLLSAQGMNSSYGTVPLHLSLGLPDFAGAVQESSQTIKAGDTATFHLQIAPQYGFTGAIALTCSGVPANSTCTVDPPAIVFSEPGSTPRAADVWIKTTASATRARVLPPPFGRFGTPLRGGVIGAWILLLVGTLWALIERRRRSALLLFGCLFLAACGGGGGGSFSAPPPPPPTPAGTSTVTVTMTATNSDGSVTTHTTTFSLTVQ